MLIQCPSCKQHYDERGQSKKCDGLRGHEWTGVTAIAEHKFNVAGTAAARARSVTVYTPPVWCTPCDEPHPTCIGGPETPPAAPQGHATASGGTDPHPTTKDA